MQPISRRLFLGGMAAAAAIPLRADPLGLPVGCQTFPVRDALGKDVDGTLRQLAKIGYRSIEMCSPPGYVNAGYGPLMKFSPSELKQKIEAAGLICPSCHFGWRELQDNLDDRIAFSKGLGLSQMVLSTFGLRGDATMSDWMAAAGQLNRVGERVAKAGLQLGFHNHDFEFHELDGALIYDRLMKELDPKLVKMQFQVSVIAWATAPRISCASTPITSFPCTCRTGPRPRRSRCRSVPATWTGRISSPRPKTRRSATTLLRWTWTRSGRAISTCTTYRFEPGTGRACPVSNFI